MIRYNGTAVPILYRIDDDGTECTHNYSKGKPNHQNAGQFEVSELKKYGAKIAILLVEKGRSFMPKGHDYLFSDFYDPYINLTDAIPTFFLYEHVFQKEILGLAKNQNTSQLELRFHRRPSLTIFYSMVIIWLLAVGCVVGGALWAFFRHKQRKRISYQQLPFVADWLLCAIQFTVCMLSLGVCIIWFIYRRSPYAFILLDFINVALCLTVFKLFRLPNVQCITVVMIFMFVYDVVMVFVTPFFTKEGCSVMEELATGIACSSKITERYPIAPIDEPRPQPFPYLMQVPIVDPMGSCVDLDIEKEFKMVILGLGDILIPGILVTHSFVMNGFSENSRIFYGVLCSIGYGFGLVLSYVAFALMGMGQPALLYLIPCTLIPLCLTAYVRGHLRLLWYGLEDLTVTTARSS
ncbi:hypothetical protein GCK32_007497 [Trichostrongylus colubriformis]|uniref:Signal peptide peptidase-like 2B n=1 Tax=Trichostrongylus colubriformis TaxID=6319 RepID=A0AAN8FBQ3_TRICO